MAGMYVEISAMISRKIFLDFHFASARMETRPSKDNAWNCGSVSWSAK